jgi:hypothetical protein
MILPVRDLLILLTAAVLLAISYATVRYARGASERFRNYDAFLFEGRLQAHSIASNVGAVFSLTGFLGATCVYSLVLQGWIQLVTIVVFAVLMLVVRQIVKRLDEAVPESTGNLLLDFFQKVCPEKDSRAVVYLYSVIYFALLVEELAVSRVVLFHLIQQPVVVGLLLCLATFVIYSYFYLGGFRAVVTADAVQLVILVLFAALLLKVVITEPAGPVRSPFVVTPLSTLSVGGSVVFGVVWFLAALDFYARLNFAGRKANARTTPFIVTSFALMLALLLVGTAFGRFLGTRVAIHNSSEYAAHLVRFFLDRSLVASLVLIAAIFAMIFTTLDTLMLATLQSGFYQKKRLFRRGTLLNIVLVAILVSTRISDNATSVTGIFIGSMFVFPAVALLRQLWPRVMFWQPRSPRHLVVAMGLTILAFLGWLPWLETRFELHFLVTLLALVMSILTGIVAIGLEKLTTLRRKKRERNN